MCKCSHLKQHEPTQSLAATILFLWGTKKKIEKCENTKGHSVPLLVKTDFSERKESYKVKYVCMFGFVWTCGRFDLEHSDHIEKRLDISKTTLT